MKKDLICISCPLGCHLTVDTENHEVIGNSCSRGKEYGISETTNPVRIITSAVKVKNGNQKLVPVKTSIAIKKDLNFDCINEINKVVVSAPIKIGDVIIKNVLNTSADIIATKNINKLN